MVEAHSIHVAIPEILNRPVKTINFSSTGTKLKDSPELELLTHLIPAMTQGLPLRLNRLPGPQLMENSKPLMDMLSRWNPSLSPVLIESKESSTPMETPSRSDKTALFFTGGIDSFYSLVTLREQLDALVFVIGFDVQTSQPELLNQTLYREIEKRVPDSLDRSLGRLSSSELRGKTLHLLKNYADFAWKQISK